MSAGARNQPIKPHKTMCLFHTRIDGVRYNLTQLRALYEKSCEENATLNDELANKEKEIAQLSTQLGEAKQRENVARNLYNEEKRKSAKLQEQLADFPTRDKNGRFKKR